MHIGAASHEDLPALIQLEQSCFATDLISARQYRRLLNSPAARILVVKKKNETVASAIMLFRKNSLACRLYSIAVHPLWQQQGIAQQLFNVLESESIQRGAQEIRLEVRKDNQKAIAFYHKNGYRLFGEKKNFYEDGEDALCMRKYFIRRAT